MLGLVVQFHESLHGFREGWGTGTTSLEENLLQKLTTMKEEVLYDIFLEIKKAYDALDRDRCINILVAYRFGQRTKRLLRKYWVRLTMVAREGQYYGDPFTDTRGVTQGEPMSTTI